LLRPDLFRLENRPHSLLAGTFRYGLSGFEDLASRVLGMRGSEAGIGADFLAGDIRVLKRQSPLSISMK